MGKLEVTNVLSGLAVRDMDTAGEWMARLLGRPADAQPMGGLAEWHLPPHGTLQVSLDPQRAGGSMVTLVVVDIAAEKQRLADVRIELNVDDTTSEEVKFAELADPDGNSIAIVEAKPGFSPQG